MTIDKFGRRRYYKALPLNVFNSKRSDNYYNIILTITGISDSQTTYQLFNGDFTYLFPLQTGSVVHMSIIPEDKVEIIVNNVNYNKSSILGLKLKYKDKIQFSIPSTAGNKFLYAQFVIKCFIQKNY